MTTGKLQDAAQTSAYSRGTGTRKHGNAIPTLSGLRRLGEKDKSQRHLEIFGRLTKEGKAQTEKHAPVVN